MKKIFVLHTEKALLKAYEDFLSAMKYEVFATSNHYKFLLYAGEIHSDFLIFDTGENLNSDFIKVLKNQEKTKNVPLLLITTESNRSKLPSEAEYILFKPFDITDFIKILPLSEKNQQITNTNNIFYVENKQKQQDLTDILG